MDEPRERVVARVSPHGHPPRGGEQLDAPPAFERDAHGLVDLGVVPPSGLGAGDPAAAAVAAGADAGGGLQIYLKWRQLCVYKTGGYPQQNGFW